MEFGFTEEQLMIQDVARRIAQEKIAPSAEQFDRSGEFPLDNIRLLGENGLMGIEVPAEYGGAGMDSVAYVLAMIEVAAADAAHSTIMSVNNSLFCNGILTHGTEAQKQKYVKAIAEGREIGAFALTEPQSGSDATAMRCRAVKQDDGSYVVNGKKSWITSGPVAKYIVLFAMTDPGKGARGITAFLIDTAREGFHRGKTEPKLGIRASATCEIEFSDYRVQPDEVLGEDGQGFKIAMGVLDAGRIGIASQAIGIARAAYEASLEYVRERKAFGKPIITNSSLQMLLKQSPTTVDNLQKLFYLTDGEKYVLLNSEVGQGILFAGYKHVAMQVIASPDESALITTKPSEVMAAEKQKKDAAAGVVELKNTKQDIQP